MDKYKAPQYILASRSPRRQQLLAGLGLAFQVMDSQVEEKIIEGESAPDLVQRLAHAKALAVHHQTILMAEHKVIIAADTVVVDEDRILGKPLDAQDAYSMLIQLQGKSHHVYTGLAIIDSREEARRLSYQVTQVRMKSLDATRIKRYIASGEPMDKAGAYAIQGLGATLIESIVGDYFNVVGLPLAHLSDQLRTLGIEVV